MIKRTWIILLITLSLPLFACKGQDSDSGAPAEKSSPVDRVALENEAREAFVAYSGLLRQSKFDEAVAYYADDPRFIWVEDGGIKYDTQAQIKCALEGISSQGVVVTNFGRPRMWALNDEQVMIYAKFRTTIDKDGDEEFTYAGAITVVMEEMESGWKFISGHTSTLPEDKGF